MIQATCIDRIRDKSGNIKYYILRDIEGKSVKLEAKQVKQAIFLGQLEVNNLTLTKDGKLISKDKNTQKLNAKNSLDVANIVSRMMILKATKMLNATILNNDLNEYYNQEIDGIIHTANVIIPNVCRDKHGYPINVININVVMWSEEDSGEDNAIQITLDYSTPYDKECHFDVLCYIDTSFIKCNKILEYANITVNTFVKEINKGNINYEIIDIHRENRKG